MNTSWHLRASAGVLCQPIRAPCPCQHVLPAHAAASILYYKGFFVRGAGRWPAIDAWFAAMEVSPHMPSHDLAETCVNSRLGLVTAASYKRGIPSPSNQINTLPPQTRETYCGLKSDIFTHVKDLPPQIGGAFPDLSEPSIIAARAAAPVVTAQQQTSAAST